MPRLYGAAAIIFLICAALLTSPWLLGRVTIPWDAKAHFYPQLVFLADALHGAELPFWNPHVFAGSPQIADPQSLIFTLPYLLLAVLDSTPGFIAADAVVFVTLMLGGLALIAFFRDRNWHPAGALVAALAFSFGGSAAWRIQHIGEVLSLAFFAITFWLLSRALERGSLKAGLGAGFFGGLMVIGRDQIAWLCTLILIGCVVWHMLAGEGRLDRLRRSISALVLGLGTGFAVIALPIALTVALAQQSTRVLIDFAGAARGSLHPAALLTAIVANLYGTDGPNPDFWGPPSTLVWGANDYVLARNMGDVYFGALPVVAFLTIGLMGGAFFRREVRFLIVAFVAMLLYALGDFTPFFHLAFRLPGSDLFRRPADATFPLCALAAILAGYAVHCMLTSEKRPRSRVAQGLVVAIPFALAVGVAVWKGRIAQAALPLTTAAVCLAVSALVLLLLRRLAPRHGAVALVVVGVCMSADLAINNGPNESTALPPAHYDVLRRDTQNDTIALLRRKLAETAGPDRRDRVELAAVGFDWPNLGMIHGFDHDLGYNPVRLAWFVAATGAQDHVAVPDQRHFSALFPSYRSRLADLLGLRFIATGVPVEELDKSLKPGDLLPVARTADAFVYENPRALPRVLFATRAQDADFEQLLKTGAWPDVDPRDTVLIEGAAQDDAVRRPGTARLSFYENTQVRIAADSPDGGWVVLNDVWHPWWRVEVDNVSAPLVQANVLFRAVRVSPGRHEVRFVFEPLAGLWAQIRAGQTQLPPK
ncbi:MAG: hypothetical protein JWM36_1761 [Hyphomicrobiales bacterium]|nr:hypothetical protein [Hyphomicrobiales bacterium]